MIDVRKQIAENSELLALPGAVLQVLESANRDEISIDSLSEIISKDPALAGRILKIANSPFYGLSHKVVSIHQAVMVLGMTTVKCLALSAALFSRDRFQDNLGIDIRAIYGNIIAVAITCRKLAVACDYSVPEDAFTCGLLHDVGLLYFLQHFPAEYRAVLQDARQSELLTDEEVKHFGVDHTEAGRLIAERWRLPARIVAAISGHHVAEMGEFSFLTDAVALAVALNRGALPGLDLDVENRISRLSVISARLGINDQQLDDIVAGIVRDTASFAAAVDVEIEDLPTILSRINQEIFNTYISIHHLFRERQELTRKILDEERERGLYEAKQVAISTLSHYINNATMAISGNAQVIRMSLKHKAAEDVIAMLPRVMDTIEISVRKIVAVLDELSELNMLDGITYYDQSKILNIDDRIKERMLKLEHSHGIVLPREAEVADR